MRSAAGDGVGFSTPQQELLASLLPAEQLSFWKGMAPLHLLQGPLSLSDLEVLQTAANKTSYRAVRPYWCLFQMIHTWAVLSIKHALKEKSNRTHARKPILLAIIPRALWKCKDRCAWSCAHSRACTGMHTLNGSQ